MINNFLSMSSISSPIFFLLLPLTPYESSLLKSVVVTQSTHTHTEQIRGKLMSRPIEYEGPFKTSLQNVLIFTHSQTTWKYVPTALKHLQYDLDVYAAIQGCTLIYPKIQFDPIHNLMSLKKYLPSPGFYRKSKILFQPRRSQIFFLEQFSETFFFCFLC